MGQTAEQKRQWYLANRENHLARSKERNAQQRKRIREFLLEYRSTHPCVDCGEADPIVLDFDHIGQKSFDMSVAYARSRSIRSIAAEIAKCEVRCANCHRRVTNSRRLGSVHESGGAEGNRPNSVGHLLHKRSD